ncbi:hypothetical protein LTR53_009258 [Teratosphaeriaceae sp. CCFEE 6253]|nr:hypothetical protein LTR53_009258 [Teratosphaeriaceae sp. CCFEE 6253]
MGKAYSPQQRERVRQLLEVGRDEDAIEKATGVSDRTIRRWKLELERTGRIGKPPESRTGRHRVLNKEVEAALFAHVKTHPEMSVDDMLWWLHESHGIVVGTRTIRRVFERKGDKAGKKAKQQQHGQANDGTNDDGIHDDDEHDTPSQMRQPYHSPYAPMAPPGPSPEQQLAQALGQQHAPQTPYAALPPPITDEELPDDEEIIQLQLQQIELQKREVELKLKMRRLQQGRGAAGTPIGRPSSGTPGSSTSTLFNPAVGVRPTPPKRDSRSKKKIEESKKRTAERQERMLRDLERRSRRRDHLTAEWVGSKDIWPLRAQGMLAQLMHQYACYTFTPQSEATFNQMYRDLYTLVDVDKGDWISQHHDELLRERMKRKMGQLRTKMQKTGEIVGRGDTYGWQRAENYTGEAAGDDQGAEVSEMMTEEDQQQAQGGALQHVLANGNGNPHMPEPLIHQQHQHQHQQHAQMQYEPIPDHGALQHSGQGMPYPNGRMAMMQHQHAQGQYPLVPQAQHGGMMPYAGINGHQVM